MAWYSKDDADNQDDDEDNDDNLNDDNKRIKQQQTYDYEKSGRIMS